MTEASTLRSFTMFPYLNEDLKLSILSFVADAPFESMPENYPKSSLTHKLPHVSKKFCSLAKSDVFWKHAIERQIVKEPFLWKVALKNILLQAERSGGSTTSVSQLVSRANAALGQPCYKSMYETVVSQHLRFKGPVFFMSGQVQLGTPYDIHFFEPRYRLLIAEVMRGQPDSAKRGGRIMSPPPMFIHANRTPLAPTTPATLVQVLSCNMRTDGSADVMLLPKAYVWLENLWVRPHSGHLYYAQCLKMGETVTRDMNKLARQETLTRIMIGLAGELSNESSDDENDDNDEDEYLGDSDHSVGELEAAT